MDELLGAMRARMAAIVRRLPVGCPDVAGPMPMGCAVKPDLVGISTFESGAGRPSQRSGITLDYEAAVHKNQ
jgi:hypothetical protein